MRATTSSSSCCPPPSANSSSARWRKTSGNQVQAAKLLGVTRATLRKRVDKFGIQKRMAIELKRLS
ncbi:MAG: helix-turn-helix domain-containing protein [Verrucomicrobiota bacterium]